jgi:mono/diheme cytochrome c family protein
MRTTLFAILMTAAVLPAFAQNGEAAAARGKELFMQVGCWQCHGRTGQGGGYTGPKLAPDPPPLAVIQAYVRHPSGDMPPYTEKVISNAGLADIRAFLLTIPRPPAAKTLPGLTR